MLAHRYRQYVETRRACNETMTSGLIGGLVRRVSWLLPRHHETTLHAAPSLIESNAALLRQARRASGRHGASGTHQMRAPRAVTGRRRSSTATALTRERAELFEKPVHSLSCQLVDVAGAAVDGPPREVSQFEFKPLRHFRKRHRLIRPGLQLICQSPTTCSVPRPKEKNDKMKRAAFAPPAVVTSGVR
jgi:hypothetical protein